MKYRVFLNEVGPLDFVGLYKTTDSVQKGEIISLIRTIENGNDNRSDKFWRVKEVVRQVSLIKKDTQKIRLFEEFSNVILIIEEIPKEELNQLFPSTPPL